MRATSSISPQNVTTDTDDKEPSISGNDNTEDVSKIVTIKLEKNSTINKSSNNNPNSTSIEKIDVKHTDTETQAKEKESTKLTDSSNTEQRKPKLSFRFRSRRPSKMESNKESSSSPVDLSAPSDVQERKKSVMATLFGNLPIIPQTHVSSATVNLKKSTEDKDGEPTKSSSSSSRRISFRLKSRRKSEAPRPISPTINEKNPIESNKNENVIQETSEANKDSCIEVQKSKSFDDNIKLSNAISDDVEEDVAVKTLAPENPRDQENNKKTNRKISRRESIVAAAASARLKWQQMKSATPSVNRMSLKKKREKREPNNIADEEKSEADNAKNKEENNLNPLMDNNNDVVEDDSKNKIAALEEIS